MPLYYGKNKIKDVGVSFKHKGGMDVFDATITSGAQLLNGVTAYGKNGKVTGTIPSQQAKTITPNNTQQVAIQSGTYAEGSVIVSAVPTEVKNITTNGTYEPESGKYFSSVNVNIAGDSFDTQTKTVSPTKSMQTITPDNGYDGLSSVTVEAIPSEYITTTDATAVATDILLGKTAYVNGEKVTGTFVAETINLDSEITEQDSIIAQIQSALEGKAAGGASLDTSDATATASDIATGKTAYVNGNKITGTHECSDGTSVDTCTLKLVYSALGSSHPISASILSNGTITSTTTSISSSKTINNVLCGSCAVITPPMFEEFIDNIILIDGVENSIDDSYHTVFNVPYKKDGVVEIEIRTSDTQDV